MDVKEANVGSLSNFEVMMHLQQIRDKKTSGQGLATITYQALKYLESSSCATQKSDKIRKCVSALGPYKLKKSEKLMICNTPPTSELEIQLMVDNSEERLTDAHVTEILSLCAAHLIELPPEDNSQ